MKRWALCILAAVALYYAADRAWEWANRSYFEFGVSVDYRGRSLTVSRSVGCVPAAYHPERFGTGRSRSAIAERLEDGSGLIVVIPGLCDGEAWPLPARYVPQIFWTPSADHPDVLEAYLSESVLRSGQARVTLRNVYARPVSRWRHAQNHPDFIIYAGDPADPYRKQEKPGLQYVGFATRLIPAEAWRRVPGLAAFMAGVTAGNLPRERLELNDLDLAFPMINDWLYIRGGTPLPALRDDDREALDRSEALRWSDGVFRPDPELRGIALLYAVDKVPPENMQVSDRNSPGVRVLIPVPGQADSFAPRWPMALGATRCKARDWAYCYDPASGAIARLQALEVYLFEAP